MSAHYFYIRVTHFLSLVRKPAFAPSWFLDVAGLDQPRDTVAFLDLQVKPYINATHENLAVMILVEARYVS